MFGGLLQHSYNKTKRTQPKSAKSLFLLERETGFEPATFSLGSSKYSNFPQFTTVHPCNLPCNISLDYQYVVV